MTPDLVDRWGERRGTEAAFDYLDLLDLFQSGTHKIKTELSEHQLNLMLMRMEGVLTSLLLVWKNTGDL